MRMIEIRSDNHNFQIEKVGDDYVIKHNNEEIHRHQRVTKLVTLESDLYGFVCAVNDSREQVLDLFLEDERLFEKLIEYFGEEIARDEEVRKYVLATELSTFLEEPINLAVKAPSSEGKTHNVVTIAKNFPQDYVMMLGDVSPTSLIHDTNAPLVDENHNPIDDKLESLDWDIEEAKNKEEKKELKKQKEELVRKANYLIDLSDKCMIFLEEPSPDFWKKFRPILSHDKKEIEYRVTDKTSSGSFKTKKAVVRGFPSVIYCTTRTEDLAIEDELKTRFLSVTTESGAEKYTETLEMIGDSEAFGDLDQNKEDFLIKELFGKVIENFRNSEVLIPCFKEALKSYFNEIYSGFIFRQSKEIARLIKIHALIHARIRPKIKVNGTSYLMAVRDDYEAIFGLVRKKTNVEPHVEVFYESIRPYLEEIEEVELSFDDDGDKITGVARTEDILNYLMSQGKYYSSNYVYNMLRALAFSGYLAKEKDPHDKRKNVYRKIPHLGMERGSKNFYERFDLHKYFSKLINKVSNKSKVSIDDKYLQLEVKDPISSLSKTFYIKDKNDISGFTTTLSHIFFRKMTEEADTKNEFDTREEIPNIRFSKFFSNYLTALNGDRIKLTVNNNHKIKNKSFDALKKIGNIQYLTNKQPQSIDISNKPSNNEFIKNSLNLYYWVFKDNSELDNGNEGHRNDLKNTSHENGKKMSCDKAKQGSNGVYPIKHEATELVKKCDRCWVENGALAKITYNDGTITYEHLTCLFKDYPEYKEKFRGL